MFPFSRVLKFAIIAGVVAGLLAAAFHFVLSEPVIDQAIQLEEQMTAAEASHTAPVVSRPVQKASLFLGFLLYGLSWSLFFSVVYHLFQQWLATFGTRKGGFVLAFLAYWSVVLIPYLKYPANPPGVGDPATIDYRQKLYFGILLLSVGGALLAVLLGQYAARRFNIRRRWLPTLVVLVLFGAGLLLLMPNNPDAVTMPAQVVQQFRWLSLAGLTLFWLGFGLCFGWLAGRGADQSSPGGNLPRKAVKANGSA